jgi:hypothetical protein
MLRWAALFALVLADGCYLRPGAAKNPAPSPEGVAIQLVGDDCEDHRGEKGQPVTRDLGIKVRVDNPTDQTLTVTEEMIRLVVDDDAGGARFPTVVEVPAHGTATLKLDFTHHALCEPSKRFVVAWHNAFRLGDRPLAIEELSFSP